VRDLAADALLIDMLTLAIDPKGGDAETYRETCTTDVDCRRLISASLDLLLHLLTCAFPTADEATAWLVDARVAITLAQLAANQRS
jgi:hypothetical protein